MEEIYTTSDGLNVSFDKENRALFLKYAGAGNQERVIVMEPANAIGPAAFRGRSSICSVSLPGSIRKIGAYAFAGCRNLEMISVENDSQERDLPSGCLLSVPKAILRKGVEVIRKGIFYRQTSQDGISRLPDVRSIAEGAFYGCTSLGEIAIPGSVSEIGERAFSACMALKRVTLHEGIRMIRSCAFSRCTSLEEIVIPSTVERVFDGAFAGCSSLRKITFLGNTKVSPAAFISCDNLGEVVSPCMKTRHGFLMDGEGNLLRYLGSNSEVTIPDGVKSIEGCAFKRCHHLTKVNIPASVGKIGAEAFAGCQNLQCVTIPSTVRRIAQKAFMDCKSLRWVNLGEGIHILETSVFQNCTNLLRVDIPRSVKMIGKRAFSGCMLLQSVELSESVSIIGSQAFRECVSIEKVALPKSVTQIGARAFMGCRSLADVSIGNPDVNVGFRAFSNCHSLECISFADGRASASPSLVELCKNVSSQGRESRLQRMMSRHPDYAIEGGLIFSDNGTAVEDVAPGVTAVKIPSTKMKYHWMFLASPVTAAVYTGSDKEAYNIFIRFLMPRLTIFPEGLGNVVMYKGLSGNLHGIE